MSHTRKILKGSASNTIRVVLSMIVALVLPPLLVHRMQPSEYGAWVLILQISGYIALLDLGLQTAIGKFVAEYDAIQDHTATARVLSSSFALLCCSALIGALGIVITAWRVPEIFNQMPPSLVGAARIGLVCIGFSTVFALPFGAFLAVFTGLQQYGFPTALGVCSRLLSAAVLAILLLGHSTLVQLAATLALFNVLTAIAQYVGWRFLARNTVAFSIRFIDRLTSIKLVKYGSVLSIWSVAMLFVSGLDLVIVGKFDFKNTGYYGVASSATNFLVIVLASVFGPLLPAISALQASRTSDQIGSLVVNTTRYCSLLTCFIALPLVIGAYPVLKLWVGHDYAVRSALFLQVLVIGNSVRQLCLPYAMSVVGTGKQHLATLAAIAEAVVNLSLSIFLVQRVGAIGVALGTLVGAFVSVGMHLCVSMKRTRGVIHLSRVRFILSGIFRPLLCIAPSLLLLPIWSRFSPLPAGIPWLFVWAASTATIGWFAGLEPNDRAKVRTTIHRLIYYIGSLPPWTKA